MVLQRIYGAVGVSIISEPVRESSLTGLSRPILMYYIVALSEPSSHWHEASLSR